MVLDSHRDFRLCHTGARLDFKEKTEMKKPHVKKILSVLYAIIIGVCAVMFFTNDFGLVDLRKTAVIIGVGIDVEDGEVKLTAQLAVPKPAENGENTEYNNVTGTGATVAAALNEVNVKTGFYPKLVFCKLILLGESCFKEDITKLLDYFYRNEYTGLTLLIAACEGSAGDLLSTPFPCGNSATDNIEKVLSAEAKASGNVASVTLKDIGESSFAPGGGAYMPYLENGVIENSSGVQNVSGSAGGGSGGGSDGGSGGGQKIDECNLTCNKCAMFSYGYCKGILPVDQTFVFNLLKNDVKHAFLESGDGEQKRVLGMRDCKGDMSLEIEENRLIFKVKFSSSINVQDSELGFSPDRAAQVKIPDEILEQGKKTICSLFEQLFKSVQKADSDIFGLHDILYKKHYNRYAEFKDNLLEKAEIKCEVKLKSVN